MRTIMRILYVSIVCFGVTAALHAELTFTLGGEGNLSQRSILLDQELEFTFLNNDKRDLLYVDLWTATSNRNFTVIAGFGTRPLNFLDARVYTGIQVAYPNTPNSRAYASTADYTDQKKSFVSNANNIGLLVGAEMELAFDITKFAIYNLLDVYYQDYQTLSTKTVARIVDNNSELGVPARSFALVNTTRLGYSFESFVIGIENVIYAELQEGGFADAVLSYLRFEHTFKKKKAILFFFDVHAGVFVVHPVFKTFELAGNARVGLEFSFGKKQ